MLLSEFIQRGIGPASDVYDVRSPHSVPVIVFIALSESVGFSERDFTVYDCLKDNAEELKLVQENGGEIPHGLNKTAVMFACMYVLSHHGGVHYKGRHRLCATLLNRLGWTLCFGDGLEGVDDVVSHTIMVNDDKGNSLPYSETLFDLVFVGE